MKKYCVILLFGLSTFLAYSCQPKATSVVENEKVNFLTEEEKSEGWKLLFDGKSTDMWRGYNHETFPTKGWYIAEDGSLAVEKSGSEEAGFGGDIITVDKYENFHMKVDFMVSDTGNSGVFYRVVERDEAIWHNAPEFQILDDDAYLEMNTMDMNTHLTGDNYDLESSAGRYSNPVGEWNTAEIILKDDVIEHRLNGKKTVSYTVGSPEWEAQVESSKFKDYPDFGRVPVGHIGLQDHGHLIKFRNIKIKPLPGIFTSLFNGKDLSGWEIYGTEKWYVEGGELICESGPDEEYGYLGTEKEFKNFDLYVDFLQEADGNSGVFFRSSIEGTKIAGWQAEVAPPGLHTGGIYESYGRGWLIQPEEGSDQSLDMGSWNTLRIKAINDQVTTWLNGKEMINLEDEKVGEATGKIALQIHSGGGIKVRWNNLFIQEL